MPALTRGAPLAAFLLARVSAEQPFGLQLRTEPGLESIGFRFWQDQSEGILEVLWLLAGAGAGGGSGGGSCARAPAPNSRIVIPTNPVSRLRITCYVLSGWKLMVGH